MEDIMQEKKRFRKEIIKKRKEIPKEEVMRRSEIIKENFINLDGYKKAKIIMAYLPFKNEVDTLPIIYNALENNKKITVPKTYTETKKMFPAVIEDLEQDLDYGNYGILEPREDKLKFLEPVELDLIIVPGVAFDENGYRLGYGGGYYDNFITKLRDDVVLAAVAFEEQVVEEVPLNSWDKKVHFIFTEDRIIDLSDSA